MTNSTEPHPLDQDWDENTPEPKVPLRTNAYAPLLKWSVRFAIGSFLVILVSTIGSLNAAPNSDFEQVTTFIHYVSQWVLLFACIGIILSFRITSMEKGLSLGIKNWLPRGYTTLVIANLIGLGVVFSVIAIGLPNLGPAGMVIPIIMLFFAAWLAVVGVWHSGYIRAYAIGTLVVLIMESSGGLNFLLQASFAMPNRFRPTQMLWLTFLFFGLPFLSGLLCATYVVFLERFRESRSNRSESSAEIPRI
ncbi:MAG: hypothetical protein ABL921_27150 [Pirellula sp.]